METFFRVNGPLGEFEVTTGFPSQSPVTQSFDAFFIRPFEKTDVLCRGNVCPSVRPSFPDFFQHALRYQFETNMEFFEDFVILQMILLT